MLGLARGQDAQRMTERSAVDAFGAPGGADNADDTVRRHRILVIVGFVDDVGLVVDIGGIDVSKRILRGCGRRVAQCVKREAEEGAEPDSPRKPEKARRGGGMAWRQSEHDGLKRSAEVSGVSDSESHRQCATAYKLPPNSPREPAEGARVR